MTAGCSQKPVKSNSAAISSGGNVADVVKMYPAGSNAHLKFAKNFNIEYLENGMKIVTDGRKRKMLLLQKGQQSPEKYKDLPSITIPINMEDLFQQDRRERPQEEMPGYCLQAETFIR